MDRAWKIVEDVIDRSDIVLEVLDARLPEGTRNLQLEKMIRNKGRQILFVLNKCDLVGKQVLEKKDHGLEPSVFISSRHRLGTTILRNKILSMAKKDRVTVGVCGYPNTGKSSLINALSGRSKARTSSISGFTKGIQLASAGRIMLIDTPGVIPPDERDEPTLAIIGARDSGRLKDPESAALRIIGLLKGRAGQFYGVEEGENVLADIARKQGRLLKGGFPDEISAAKMVVRDWQNGRLS